jgi:hypothetical protein
MPLMRLPIFMVLIVSAMLSYAARAQVRTEKVVPERPARVFVMAGMDSDCRSLSPVVITVTQEPKQGRVSLRENQQSQIQYSVTGKCAGARAIGTGIYYTALAGAKGGDSFTVDVRLGSLSTTRTFEVQVADD